MDLEQRKPLAGGNNSDSSKDRSQWVISKVIGGGGGGNQEIIFPQGTVGAVQRPVSDLGRSRKGLHEICMKQIPGQRQFIFICVEDRFPLRLCQRRYFSRRNRQPTCAQGAKGGKEQNSRSKWKIIIWRTEANGGSSGTHFYWILSTKRSNILWIEF